MYKPRALSLFSGAGGFDLGFTAAGFDIVLASDLEPLFCESIRRNKPSFVAAHTEVVAEDVRKLLLHKLPEDIDLVIGGPPCQSFSASGRRAGGAPGQLDQRGTLFRAYCDILAQLQPRAFVFENVRGILGSNKGRDWQDIQRSFADRGYKLDFRILDASGFGVAQRRERVFLVGHRLDGDFLFPRPTHGPDSRSGQPCLGAAAALQGIDEDEDLDSLALRSGKYAHLVPQVPPGENYHFFTAKRGHPAPVFAYRSRFSDFLYKAAPETPTKTLIASPGKYTGPLHWDNRYMSLRELKRLQGFPDDYVFAGKRADVIRQIGNSVVPVVAEHLARAVSTQIFGRAADVELLDPAVRLSFDRRKRDIAKQRRQQHAAVASRRRGAAQRRFKAVHTDAEVLPHRLAAGATNATFRDAGREVRIDVRVDSEDAPFVTMRLGVGRLPALANTAPATTTQPRFEKIVEVAVRGGCEEGVRAMWNALDLWVRRASHYTSLFDLYGHFAEPHPDFEILAFTRHSDRYIARFAERYAVFSRCATLAPRKRLMETFGADAEVTDSLSLIAALRRHRFDVRCHETNVAIPNDAFMVAYPFTIPDSKQMSIGLRKAR